MKIPDFTAEDLSGQPLGSAQIQAHAPALIFLLRGIT